MKETIAIIGAGNVGKSLAHAFSVKGYRVKLGVRNLKSASDVSNSIEICTLNDAVNDSDITLLTVPDSAIESVCLSLANEFKQGSIVAHCSGAITSKVLQSAQTKKCLTASAHPLNTFPNPTAALQLLSNQSHNTYLYCEGEQSSLNIIDRVFSNIGFNFIEINVQSKPLYHAACVFACNYLTVLMDLSLQTANAANLNPETYWNSIQPLIQSTLSNITQHGTAGALSGPVARADIATIQQHANQLEPLSQDLHDTYIKLAAHATELALKSNTLSEEKTRQLTELINLITNKS